MMAAHDPISSRVAERCAAAGILLTPAGVAAVAGYLDEERAGDREAERLGRGGEVGGAHGAGYAAGGLASS